MGSNKESHHQSGMSIVSVLVALALVSAIVMIVLATVEIQTKSLRYFSNKSDVIELKMSLTQAMANENTCKWQLVGINAKVNAQTPQILASQEIKLQQVYAGATATSPVLAAVGKEISPGLKVASIKIADFSDLGIPGAYRATLEVAFENELGRLALAPVRIGQFVYTNKTEPINAQSVVGCAKGTGTISCEGGLFRRVQLPTGHAHPQFYFSLERVTAQELAAETAKGLLAKSKFVALNDMYEGEIFPNAKTRYSTTVWPNSKVPTLAGVLAPVGGQLGQQAHQIRVQCVNGEFEADGLDDPKESNPDSA